MLNTRKIATAVITIALSGLTLTACQSLSQTPSQKSPQPQPYLSYTRPSMIAPTVPTPIKIVATPDHAIILPLTDEKLQSYHWQLMTVTDRHGKPLSQGLFYNAAKPLLVDFEAGDKVRFFNTCNQMFADYMLTNDNVLVGDFVSTRMQCEPALMAMDTLAPHTLKGQFKLTLDGAGEPVLTVTGDKQISVFKPVSK